MKIMYQLFEEESVLIQRFSGVFSIEDFVRYNRSRSENPKLKQVNKVLIDFRDIEFDAFPEDFRGNMNRIVEVRKDIDKKVENPEDIVIVFLVDKPIPTVIAHMFKSNFPNLNYNYCSSLANAVSTLKLSVQFNHLDQIINKLGNVFI